MINASDDLLYQIFLRYLHDFERAACVQELVYEVVGDYLFALNEFGHTPNCYMDDIEDLIRDEVLEMFRKKTYGFQSLEDYRRSLDSKSH